MSRHKAEMVDSARIRSRGEGCTLIDMPAVRKGERGAFTLIELLVVIAIIAILAAILVPAVQNALQTAIRTELMASLHGFGIAMHQYTHDREGVLPGPLMGGQGARYTSSSPLLSRFLWEYLDEEEPQSRTEAVCDILVDPHREAAGFPTRYLRCGNIKPKGVKAYDPFGYPTKDVGELGDDNRPSPLDVVEKPAITWLFHDVDKQSVPRHPGWYDSLPEGPFHEKNIVLFFDGHCEIFEKEGLTYLHE